MHTLWQDVHFGARMLLKNPGISFVVILALALGIGANTAIFSVVNAVLLRPLPYDEADRLVSLAESSKTMAEFSISFPNFTDWRNQNHVFERMGVYNRNSYNLTGSGDPERILTCQASADLFSALRVQAAIGRVFTGEEDKPGAIPVVVLSYGLWQRRFGGQSSILNQQLTFNNKSLTVIGVMPQGFQYPGRVEMWVPIGQLTGDPNWQQRANHNGLIAVARLKPGVTLAQAKTDMDAIAANLDVSEHTALQVKQAVVGYGRADKKQVQVMVQRLLCLSVMPVPDAADALACAICDAHGARLAHLAPNKGGASTRDRRSRAAWRSLGERLVRGTP